MHLQIQRRPTEALIDLEALAFNFHSSKAFIGRDIAYMAVIKADAYGHGAVTCARRLESEGIDWFGVAIPEEGAELRTAGIKSPILCLGSYWQGQEKLLVENDLTTVVYDNETAVHLDQFAKKCGWTFDIHVKIDTGMGRVGLGHGEAAEFASLLKQLSHLRVTGVLTHFASAEDPVENDFTALQIERFNLALEAFRHAGHDPIWIDLANSPGAIAHPESRGNMVRLGGALYGLIDDILPADAPKPLLKPLLSLRTRVIHLRQVPAGESLGYGRTFTTKRDSVIALIPIGYADGYPRRLSNRGQALVNDSLVPVVGRVSMDWTLLDVTNAMGVASGDDVFLIGGRGQNTIKAADVAAQLDTIGYEITCGISKRVPRVYFGTDEVVT